MWLRMNLTYHGIMGTSTGYPRMEHEENVWDGESGWMFPVKILTGHGENSMNRRYRTPQM